MKKYEKLLAVILIITALAACLSGCNFILGKLGLGSKFSLSTGDVTLKIGEVYEVQLSSNSIEEGFKLVSADPDKVRIIDDIKLEGIAKTDTAVTVTATSDSGKTATIAVTVTYADLGELSLVVTEGIAIQLLSPDETIEQITFGVDTNAGINPATTFNWTVAKENSSDVVSTGTGTTFSFTPTQRDVLYDVTVTAGDLTDDTKCGVYNAIFISSDKVSFEVDEEVSILVMFRPDDTFTGNTAMFTVYKNGLGIQQEYAVTVKDGVGQAEISLGGFMSLGDVVVKVGYGEEVSNELTITITRYPAANHINISASNATLLQQRGTSQTVGFTANLLPDNANYNAVEWYVNGIMRDTGATFNFRPEENGEYKIEAVIGKLSSPKLTVVMLSTEDPRDEYARDNFTDYGGYPQNRLISSQEELNAVVVYALENQLYGSADNTLNLYIDFDYGEQLKEELDTARQMAVEAGIIAGYATTTDSNGKEVELSFDYYLEGIEIVNSPIKDATDIAGNSTEQSVASKPHYTAGTYTRSFYIDGSTQTMNVGTSNMLYKAVEWGYKPVFTGTSANREALQQIYDNARSVLASIITDDMTETEKVHAIYDWIIYNVRYDYDLADAADDDSVDTNINLNNKMKCYGYYLEGIFLDRFFDIGDSHAVCDGKSKAFVLLCGIEGITAKRISGYAASGTWQKVTNPATYENSFYIFKQVWISSTTYKYVKYAKDEAYNVSNCWINYVESGGNRYNAAGGHAWNKVLLDPDDDGTKDWFTIDTTWGDRAVNVSGQTIIPEYLTHGYFLVNDYILANSHVEDNWRNYPAAEGNYDYYMNTYITHNGVKSDLYIDNKVGGTSQLEQLTNLFRWANANNVKYVEFEYEGTLNESTLRSAARSAGVNLKYDNPLSVRSGVYGVVLN